MMKVRELLQDAHTDDLPGPAEIRTPGRTWTTFEADVSVPGSVEINHVVDGAADVMGLATAYEQYPNEVEAVLFRELAPDTNTITAAHVQQLQDAVFVYLPEGSVTETVEIDIESAGGFAPHHVLVYAADGAVGHVIETNRGDADCDSSLAEVYVGDGATVNYTKVNALEGAGYSDNAATVDADGTVNWLMVSTGAELYRNEILTRLYGSRSDLQYDLAFLASDEQHLDHTAHVIHDGDNSRCDMDSRGVVMDKARAVYKGVQEVKETTNGTKSFQDERTIMIGDDCEADTTPQLQIDNNDVEATHAATTGHIDKESLFYMKSRGLREQDATREIITGMFDDLIERSGADAAMDAMHEKIADTLGTR